MIKDCMILRTHSPEETRALGMVLGAALHAGDTVLLRGDMGAGKSELARGIAGGLGITGAVPSPSFTIMQQYTKGRIPLYHFDCYRLSGAAEFYAMGMEEYIEADGIAMVEWPDRAEEAMPSRYLGIAIRQEGEEDDRILDIVTRGGFKLTVKEEQLEHFSA